MNDYGSLDLPINIDKLWKSFASALLWKGRSKSTINTYRAPLRGLTRWGWENGHGWDPTKYTASVIRGYLLSLVEAGRSEKTRATYWAALRTFYTFLVDEEGELNESPMKSIKPPTVHDKEQPVYEEDEIAALTTSLEPKRWSAAPPRERFLAARDAAMVWTLYAEGFRSDELRSMRIVSDDPLDARVIITRKGGAEQEMLLSKRSTREILRYRRLREQYEIGSEESALWVEWTGRPVTDHVWNTALARRLKAVNVQWKATHSFRRSSAIYHIEAGMGSNEMKDQFGWKSDTMLRLYVKHGAQVRAGKAHRKFSPGG